MLTLHLSLHYFVHLHKKLGIPPLCRPFIYPVMIILIVMCLVFSKCDLSIPLCTVRSYHKYFILMLLVQKPISIHQTQHISVIENQPYNRYLVFDGYLLFLLYSQHVGISHVKIILLSYFHCVFDQAVYILLLFLDITSPILIPFLIFSVHYLGFATIQQLWECQYSLNFSMVFSHTSLCSVLNQIYSICLFSFNSYFPHKRSQNPNI